MRALQNVKTFDIVKAVSLRAKEKFEKCHISHHGKFRDLEFDPSRSSEVNKNGTVGKPVYKFLFVFLNKFSVSLLVSKLFTFEFFGLTPRSFDPYR